MTQSHRQLINFLSLPIKLTPMVKTLIIVSAINCWNKTQNMLGVSHLNLFIQPKLKTYTKMHRQIPIIC